MANHLPNVGQHSKTTVYEDLETSKTFAELSREWAISEELVQGEDFSSKYWAFVAQEAADAAGQNNTASNIGSGVGVFHQKFGFDLQFKSLEAGVGISIADKTDTVLITSELQDADEVTYDINGTTPSYGFGNVQDTIEQIITDVRLIESGSTLIGTWDADANIPDLTIVSPTDGDYWLVSVDGNTDLDGITTWLVGDWAIYSDGAFSRLAKSGEQILAVSVLYDSVIWDTIYPEVSPINVQEAIDELALKEPISSATETSSVFFALTEKRIRDNAGSGASEGLGTVVAA